MSSVVLDEADRRRERVRQKLLGLLELLDSSVVIDWELEQRIATGEVRDSGQRTLWRVGDEYVLRLVLKDLP